MHSTFVSFFTKQDKLQSHVSSNGTVLNCPKIQTIIYFLKCPIVYFSLRFATEALCPRIFVSILATRICVYALTSCFGMSAITMSLAAPARGRIVPLNCVAALHSAALESPFFTLLKRFLGKTMSLPLYSSRRATLAARDSALLLVRRWSTAIPTVLAYLAVKPAAFSSSRVNPFPRRTLAE